MDSQIKPCRSLPPLVEGKIQGSLKLVIDEVLWIRRSPGDVTVVASWWGEHDNAQFRPIDNTRGIVRTNENTTEVYAIKTNATLFEDYIKNCDTIELVIVAENIHEVIGKGHIGELFKIFSCKYYSQFISILSNSGHRIGKVHVSLQLTYLTKLSNMQLKTCKFSKNEDSDILLFAIDNLQYNEKIPVISYNNEENIKEKKFIKSDKIDAYNTYKSVLTNKQSEFQESRKKLNEIVTDKLVAQIIARAQHLREVILKETLKEDSVTLNDSSLSEGSHSNASAENKVKLYKYLLGMEMISSDEKKILDMLRLTSPSLIDLASKIITTDKDDINTTWNKNFSVKSNNPKEDILNQNTTYIELKGIYPLDYVNSIRILVESFTLSPTGYRCVKSTCLQYGIPLLPTYFIQYDTTFGSIRQTNTKSSKETKFMRTCAKKQVGQVVNFNSEGIYSISKRNANRNFPLKFKVFVKHHNQNLPTGLGFGFMNISGIINTTNLSSTQCIAIVNKGIKIGELKVTTELGCDFIYFGKEFVDAVMSRKKNIPVLKKSLMSSNGNKYKSATGTHSSKSNNKVSSVSAKRIECLTSNSNKDLIITKDMIEHQEQSLDNKKIDISNPESGTKNKVLLHGLIYVAEGRNLPESNTYLICRAFWREDKTTSQICNNTKNPFYHFFQLVPLIHDTELLERIRDNYIIIEVYSRQNSGTDNLLGIAKLPVHQLYTAFRDPRILSHLLLSKYPVISVDGWVNINDPVSGKFCGELLALVALGTMEQIALLEVSRGLRNTSNVSRTNYSYHCCVPDNTNNTMNGQENLQYNILEVSNLNSGQSACDNNFAYVYSTLDRDLASVDYNTQESQTDISSLRNARSQKPIQETASSERLALRALVDRLVNALHISKINTDQSAQTEINQADEGEIHKGELCLNSLNSNNLTDDSDSCNPKNDFQLPTEMCRSVGVGAENDEDLAQQRNNAYNKLSNSSLTEENAQKIEPNINCNSSYFQSIVEIECALHLPKIKGLNELVEPSTYVTFQDLTCKFDSTNEDSYMATNVFPHNCNPKWNWRCDAKLSIDLLLNNQKRLILKVWHLIDPYTSKDIDLRKDIVIGFSAVDLSVLMAGFPMVSGWFHIMDFTGKCKGQIKISITPLDNLPSLRKVIPTNATNLSRCSNLSQTNWLHLHNTPYSNTESNDAYQILSYASPNNYRYVQPDLKLNDADICYNLDDVSMSFLSSSLKQKLTELDEITKRLQSRLYDVTNTAFEDEFDNDFDIIEPSSDNENTNDRNAEIAQFPQCTDPEYFTNKTSQTPKQCVVQNDQNVINDEKQTCSIISSNYNFEPASKLSRVISSEATDIGYCSNSNICSNQHPGYYHNQYKSRYSSRRNYSSDSNAEYPVRGTKTHINHLLDKLSLDLPPRSSSEAVIPIRKNILELFASLREYRNNSQDKEENGHEINTCTVLTPTDNCEHIDSHATNFITSETIVGENIFESSVESPHNRISTVIREELVAEENNDSINCDELTTYLITSNIRHMDLDSIFNPLLYQHLVPDLQVTAAVSPEGEAAEQLDNRYARNFDIAMQDSNIDHSKKNNTLFRNDAQLKDQITVSEFNKNKEFFGLTSSNVSENVDNSIDVTIIYKSSENDLTSGTSTESAAIISFDKSSIQQSEVKTEHYCSIVSELSVPGVSRQAPEGGNPIEEVKTSVVAKRQNNT